MYCGNSVLGLRCDVVTIRCCSLSLCNTAFVSCGTTELSIIRKYSITVSICTLTVTNPPWWGARPPQGIVATRRSAGASGPGSRVLSPWRRTSLAAVGTQADNYHVALWLVEHISGQLTNLLVDISFVNTFYTFNSGENIVSRKYFMLITSISIKD